MTQQHDDTDHPHRQQTGTSTQYAHQLLPDAAQAGESEHQDDNKTTATPYGAGRTDGARDHIDTEAAMHPHSGQAYRDGLHDARTAKIDDELASNTIDEAVTTDLLRRERADERLQIGLGPWSAYMLVTGVQTSAGRWVRPDGSEESTTTLRGLRHASAAIERHFTGTAAGTAIETGWRRLWERGYRW